MTTPSPASERTKAAPKLPLPPLRARLSKPDDLKALWWLERGAAEKLYDVPYPTFRLYVEGKEDPNRRCVVVEGRGADGKGKGPPVAFCLFRVGRAFVHCVDLVVDKAYRRRGLGRKMLHSLGRLPEPYPPDATVSVGVRERDLHLQLWLKASGFRCNGVIPSAFDFPPDSAYSFVWEPPQKP